MCMIDGCDSWDFFSDSTKRARIEHTCDECSRTITPGEVYERAVGMMDDRWSTFKTCPHCLVTRTWLVETCSGWLFEGVLIELEEHWDEDWTYHSMWLGRAILSMRSKHQKNDGSLRPLMEPYKLPKAEETQKQSWV